MKQTKKMQKSFAMIVSTTIVSLIVGIWWLLLGEITFLHYPNSQLATNAGCGKGWLDLHHSWGMFTLVRCFQTTDSSDQVVNWYKGQGWFVSGERQIFPNITISQLRLERGREFLVKRQDDNHNLLIVQQFTYRYTLNPLSTSPS